MTLTLTFWLIAAAMLLVGMLFVFLPLWRGHQVNNDVLRDAANLEILRDQSAELRADLQNGLLTQAAFDQGLEELKSRLLDEVKTTQAVASVASVGMKRVAIGLVLVLPLVGVLLYQKLSNPLALHPEAVAAIGGNDGTGLLQTDSALQALEEVLKNTTDKNKLLEGWLQLARSYAELKRYPDAVRAYAEVVKLAPDESQAWTEYADAYAMKNGQTLKGEPTQFLEKALKLDPKNNTALALSGSAAMERGDYEAAIKHWQTLIGLLPKDYPDVQMIRDGVKTAREYLAQQPGGAEKLAKLPALPEAERVVANPQAAVAGKVTLGAALAGKVSPEDTVFILARAAEGPKMPLAVLRKQVKDLPFEFTLDDSLAMQPQLKLSGFPQVVVVARISKAGQPIAQAGDWEGSTASIKPGSKGLNIVIEHEVK